MKTPLLLIIILAVILSSCETTYRTYTSPVQKDIQKTAYFDSDYDAVWSAVITWFADNKMPIGLIEKTSGYIVSGSIINQDNQMTFCDCGKGGRIHTTTYKINVVVSNKEGKTKVKINTFWDADGNYDIVYSELKNEGYTKKYAHEYNGKLTCYSNGAYEAQFFEYISNYLK
jgi:hypothetical protein